MIKIIHRREPISISSLKVGDWFQYGENIYYMWQLSKDSATVHVLCFKGERITDTCFNLSTPVIPIKVKMTLEVSDKTP